MKKTILFIILVIGSFSAISQTVPSSCLAADSVVSKYIDDADRLTLRKIYRNNLTYTDSIDIPKTHTDTILDALIAVYNASLSARDTVIDIFDIHTFTDPTINAFYIIADSNLYWMEELQNGNLTTGHHVIDSLIANYNLNISYYYSSSLSLTHYVGLVSDANYNITALIQGLDTISGVSYVEPESWVGDGANIVDSIYSDHVELIYSFGWGDCPSGCTGRRFWKFNIYFDCSVEFVEGYGNQLDEGFGAPFPETGISSNNLTSISVFPNPFIDNIIINGAQSDFNYQITNIMGQKIKAGSLNNLTINNLGSLPSGVYFLKLNEKEQIHKIIKK